MKRSESDPGMDQSSQRPHTGLEEPVRQMGFTATSDAAGDESTYPDRPGEPDCIYFLRTGFCRYGERCRFNHPHDRGPEAYGAARACGEDYPERLGQHVCQYFMRTGACKFGSSCKYHHPRHEAGSASALTVNFHGYPLRPGEKECSYYMRYGQCKFGVTCKFHHPQYSNVQVPAVASRATALPGPPAMPPSIVYPTVPHATPQQYEVAAGSWQVAQPPMVPGSYIQGPYGSMLFSTGVVPVAGWTPYTASFGSLPSLSTQSTVGAGQLYGVPPISPVASVYTGPYPPMTYSAGPSSTTQKELTHPERPGQPECQHYLRTGECKYGSSCRYHHPSEWSLQKSSYAFTPMVLPLRPGAPTCTHFMQHGVCKFGSSCKFNHPMGSLSYSPSTSSLYDMPVAPYPVGYSIAAVAPSYLSSDLRIEAISGSKKDSPTKISPLPSVSTGALLSKTAPSVPHSGTQDPTQISTIQATTPSSASGQ